MAYKVKCRLVAFIGDVEQFPCHFGYEIGDEFIYDGEKFIGRICPALFHSGMLSIIDTIRYNGTSAFRNYPWLYSGISKKDPSMKKYDGVGWANVKEIPKDVRKEFTARVLQIPAERYSSRSFICDDPRTLAMFTAEPFGLSDKGFDLPFYRRQMSILGKIKAEPGLGVTEVLERFSKWEREDIYPRLGPANVEIMLEELEGAGYIELRDGKAYAKS
jgi:uncharacterized repeat protein (TIGR04076 family)